MCRYCWGRGATPHIAEVEKYLGWEEGGEIRMDGGLLKTENPVFAEIVLSW